MYFTHSFSLIWYCVHIFCYKTRISKTDLSVHVHVKAKKNKLNRCHQWINFEIFWCWLRTILLESVADPINIGAFLCVFICVRGYARINLIMRMFTQILRMEMISAANFWSKFNQRLHFNNVYASFDPIPPKSKSFSLGLRRRLLSNWPNNNQIIEDLASNFEQLGSFIFILILMFFGFCVA